MNEITQLKQRIETLEKAFANLQAGFSLPLSFDQALQGRGFIKAGGSAIFTVPAGGTGASTLTGILKGNGTSAFTAIVPKSGSGSFWVAASSNGATTTEVSWNSGVITNIG